MSFEPLRHIVARTIRSNSRSVDLEIARVFDVSRRVLGAFWGEERAQLVIPISFKEGVLKCETTSPAAKQHLHVEMMKLKNEMNRQLGVALIAKIMVVGKGF